MFANLIGDGAGVILMFIAWLMERHISPHTGKVSPWVIRGAIVVAFMGGSLIIGTSLATWGVNLITGLGKSVGVAGLVVFTCLALFLLVICGVGLWKAHWNKAVYAAMVLPLVLTLTGAGGLHQFGQNLIGPAQQQGHSIIANLTGR